MNKKILVKMLKFTLLGFILVSMPILLVNAEEKPDSDDSGFVITTKEDGTVYLDGEQYYDSIEDAGNAENTIDEKSDKKIGEVANKWVKYKTRTYKTSYDKDVYICSSSDVESVKLTTSSKSKVETSGSAKFDFKKVASLELSKTIGTEWGEEFTQSIKPKKGKVYILESYCKVKERKYYYYDIGILFDKTYFASSHDAAGNFKEITTKDLPKVVKITSKNKSVKQGKTIQLKCVVKPNNAAYRKVKWSVSNKKYATITQKGKLTAKAAGVGKTVKVTVRSKGYNKIKSTITIKIKK